MKPQKRKTARSAASDPSFGHRTAGPRSPLSTLPSAYYFSLQLLAFSLCLTRAAFFLSPVTRHAPPVTGRRLLEARRGHISQSRFTLHASTLHAARRTKITKRTQFQNGVSFFTSGTCGVFTLFAREKRTQFYPAIAPANSDTGTPSVRPAYPSARISQIGYRKFNKSPMNSQKSNLIQPNRTKYLPPPAASHLACHSSRSTPPFVNDSRDKSLISFPNRL